MHGAAAARPPDALEKRARRRPSARSSRSSGSRDDGASLDRRVSSLEASVRDVGARLSRRAPPRGDGPCTAPRGGLPPRTIRHRRASGPAWNNPTIPMDRTERRAELAALSDEFRSRSHSSAPKPGGTEDNREDRARSSTGTATSGAPSCAAKRTDQISSRGATFAAAPHAGAPLIGPRIAACATAPRRAPPTRRRSLGSARSGVPRIGRRGWRGHRSNGERVADARSSGTRSRSAW